MLPRAFDETKKGDRLFVSRGSSIIAIKRTDALNLEVGDRVCLGPPELQAIVANLWCFNNTVYVIWTDPKCHQLIQSQFYCTATLFVYL
jgi:hypothetical protein